MKENVTRWIASIIETRVCKNIKDNLMQNAQSESIFTIVVYTHSVQLKDLRRSNGLPLCEIRVHCVPRTLNVVHVRFDSRLYRAIVRRNHQVFSGE